jgi:hypothetical protein
MDYPKRNQAFRKIADTVGDNWRNVALQMGKEPQVCVNHMTQADDRSPSSRCYFFLRCLGDNREDGQLLADALRICGYEEAAQTVEALNKNVPVYSARFPLFPSSRPPPPPYA